MASGAHAQTPPPPTPWLRDAMSPEMRSDLEQTPAFLRDSKLGLNLRNYYFDQKQSNGTYREAWAQGGALSYQSGWLEDVFQMGGVFYNSSPLWKGDNAGATKLLTHDADAINVVGEAWGKLRWEGQTLTGYRQRIDYGYVNSQDNRMVPNTFEAGLLSGGYEWMTYAAGYLWGMKPRERTNFVPLSQVAGAGDTDKGGWLGDIRIQPWQPLWVDLSGIYVDDLFATTFLNSEYVHRVDQNLLFGLGLQYTDQRSIGSNLIGDFSTWNFGARVRGLWHGVGVELAYSQTSEDFNIQTPFGSYPGYLSLINKDFDVAGQKAWGIKLTNDFSNVGLPGLTGFFWYADGYDAVNPSTGRGIANFSEYDFDLTYAPTREQFGGKLYGLSVKARAAFVAQEGISSLQPDYRVIINYAIPLL